MLINKKGFTLIELVLVLIILGVILIFALPNVTSTLERNKKDQMIIDAKDMVDKAKNYALKSYNIYPTSEGTCSIELKLVDIDPREEIKQSSFGKNYNTTNSYVKICLNSGSYVYKVKLIDDGDNSIGVFDVSGATIDGIDYMELNGSDKYKLVKIA